MSGFNNVALHTLFTGKPAILQDPVQNVTSSKLVSSHIPKHHVLPPLPLTSHSICALYILFGPSICCLAVFLLHIFCLLPHRECVTSEPYGFIFISLAPNSTSCLHKALEISLTESNVSNKCSPNILICQ